MQVRFLTHKYPLNKDWGTEYGQDGEYLHVFVDLLQGHRYRKEKIGCLVLSRRVSSLAKLHQISLL